MTESSVVLMYMIPQNDEGLDWLIELPVIERLKLHLRDLQTGLSAISNEQGYEVVSDQEGAKIFYKQDADDIMHVRVRAVFDCAALDLFTLANELDLWPANSQEPGTMEVSLLHQFSQMNRVVYFKRKLKWPMDDRDYINHGVGVDMLDQGKVAFLGKSVRNVPGVDIPPHQDGYRRFAMHEAHVHVCVCVRVCECVCVCLCVCVCVCVSVCGGY
jgi:hypothetical protein